MESLMELHLFGATTPTGEAFRQRVANLEPHVPLYSYSRRSADDPADFRQPGMFIPAGEPGAELIWISFGPIWLLAPFLKKLARNHPDRLAGLRGLIACSSSSVLTKRFAANSFDRELVARLRGAERQLLDTCHHLQVPCCILQPTLIYGQVGAYSDSNLSRLLQVLKKLPLLPLPAQTGLRQPIHARQLAAVTFHLAQQLSSSGWNPDQPERIPLGGDEQLSYRAMLQALQKVARKEDSSIRCWLLPIPNRLFFLLAAPLLLRSPKAYEAVLRMGADLAGFTPSHKLLAEPPQPFPLHNL